MLTRRWAAVLALPTALVAGGWTHAPTQIRIGPDSRLWVEGTSTVRGYKCQATKIDGIVGYQGDLAGALEAAGRAVKSVTIDVPVAALDCGNGTMNEHMRKALKAGENPVIGYRMTAHEVTARQDGTLQVDMTGMLTLAGESREIAMTADATLEQGGRYRITGAEELAMTEFGIRPPTLMLGTLKVHDKIVVRYEMVLDAR